MTALLLVVGCSENYLGIRNTPPTAEITSHREGDAVVEGIAFPARGVVGDTDSPAEELQATWLVAGVEVPECLRMVPDEDGETECSITMLHDVEPWRVQLQVRDPRDALGTADVDLEILAQQEGYGSPLVDIDEPADGSTISTGDPVTFRGSVSDAQDEPSAIAVEWMSDRDGVLSTAGLDSSGTSLFVQPALSSGFHVITLRATDSDGNFATAVITLDVDGVPSAPTVAIAPDPAPSSRDLSASAVGSVDPEGDPVTYTYEWLRDGVVQPAETSATVLAPLTTRGQTWTVRAYAHDTHGGVSAPGEASVLIDNAPPAILSATISPDPAYTSSVLVAAVSATDDDGDTVTLAYDWQVGGASTGAVGSSLDGLVHFDRGDVVQVVVTPTDGSDSGVPVGSNVVSVLNSAPTTPTVQIAPTVPVEQQDDLYCAVLVPATDPDGDAFGYDFSWTVDGLAYPQPAHNGPFQTLDVDDTADGLDTFDGEQWTCSVAATDSLALSGVPGQASVTIGQLVFTPDYNGTFDVVPDIGYSCAFGLVSVNVSQLTFSVAGATLSVTGAPAVMRQTPAPADENFSATGIIPGGCDETYTIGGTFQDDDHFIGTFSVSFNGAQCGFTNCQNQVWPVDGYRL